MMAFRILPPFSPYVVKKVGTKWGQLFRASTMGYQWHQLEEGIRVREHPTRKHGLKPDLYFTIRYQKDGKRQEESLGWASQGITLRKARLALAQLREAARTGNGASRLHEQREEALAARKIEQETALEEERKNQTFSQFWNQVYWPSALQRKSPGSLRSESAIFRKWLQPHIGEMRLKTILPGDVQNIVDVVLAQGKAPRTAQYVVAVISQVWNAAYGHELVSGENPVRCVKKPRTDNRRMRFLSRKEARALLEEIKPRSKDLYDTCLLALFCGLRAGEIYALRWGDISFEGGEIFIRDPKNGYNRYAYMTAEVRAMLRQRFTGQGKNELVFPANTGSKRVQASKLFNRCVDALRLNDGYIDRRQRIVFHSLRHTFASWHVGQGTPLYQVGTLLGHRTPQMIQRYSHVSPDVIRKAAMTLEGALT